MNCFKAWKIKTEDTLRYSRVVRRLLARWYFHKGNRLLSDEPQQIARSIELLCKGARLVTSQARLLPIEGAIRKRVQQLRGRTFDWTEFAETARDRNVFKAAVIKPRISDRERGVIYVSFEYQWLRLLQIPNLKEFARDYTLVVIPVWSPPHGLINYLFPEAYPDRLVCTINMQKDLEDLPRISSKNIMVPLLCSNWVNPALFKPRSFAEKDVDIMMVANWGRYKRHHALFEALRRLPSSLRVMLIGQRDGTRTAEVLNAEAAAFGVAGRFELKQGLPHRTVCEELARAKTSLILSRREGSCVAVIESIFANTPVGLFEDAEVGSRHFVNEHTGRFLKHHNLAAQLQEFLAQAEHYQPRQWALDNRIDCHGSTATLNTALQRLAASRGEEWTRDIVPIYWGPDPLHVDPQDRQRFQATYDDLKRRFGIVLGPC
jgi:glycosyltransferase involved in cell wall biosynthesis